MVARGCPQYVNSDDPYRGIKHAAVQNRKNNLRGLSVDSV